MARLVLTSTTDKNRDQFEKEIYGPLYLELEVETHQDSKMVEMAVGAYAFRFLAQTQKDFDTLHTFMKTDREFMHIGKGINIVNASKVKKRVPSSEKIENLK